MNKTIYYVILLYRITEFVGFVCLRKVTTKSEVSMCTYGLHKLLSEFQCPPIKKKKKRALFSSSAKRRLQFTVLVLIDPIALKHMKKKIVFVAKYKCILKLTAISSNNQIIPGGIFVSDIRQLSRNRQLLRVLQLTWLTKCDNLNTTLVLSIFIEKTKEKKRKHSNRQTFR